MMFTIIGLAFTVVLFVLGFASLFRRASTDAQEEIVHIYAQTLFQASLGAAHITALCKWMGLCLALFLVGCSSPLDRALRKADELNAKNPVIVCIEKSDYTECAVSGDNYEGVFLLRCSWYCCEEIPPLTKP